MTRVAPGLQPRGHRRLGVGVLLGALTFAIGCERSAPAPSADELPRPVTPAAPVAARANSEAFRTRGLCRRRGWRAGARSRRATRTGLPPASCPARLPRFATLTEALDRRVIDAGTRIACGRQVVLANGRRADCSHPPVAAPFDVADALAQSCNFFAATVAPAPHARTALSRLRSAWSSADRSA